MGKTSSNIRARAHAPHEGRAADAADAPGVIGRSFETDRPDVYRQLLKTWHPNILGVLGIDKTENGAFLVTEEYFEGLALRECLANGADEREFVYYMMQLCDALDFLHELEPPVAHGGVAADNILINADGALKLTNFDRAQNAGDRAGDIAAVGKLLKSTGRIHARKYRSVIEKCGREGEGEYKSFGDIYKDIEGRNLPFVIRRAGLIAVAVMGLFFFARMLPRLLRGFFG
jgi:serine/threonine protein kinase